MRRSRLGGLAAAVAIFASAAEAEDLLRPDFKTASPRQVYVSCYLLLQGDYGARESAPHAPLTCASLGIAALVLREGKKDGEPLRFCLPDSATQPSDAMAQAYVDVFDAWPAEKRNRTDVPNIGLTAFVAAQIAKYPCG